MSDGQKVIKYLAIAFAIFLSVNIIGGIITAIFFGISIFDINFKIQNNQNSTMVTNEEMVISQNYDNIEKLKVEIGYSKLEIKQGEKLKVEANTNNNKITTKKTGDTLIIKEDSSWNIFKDDIESHIIITVPENYYFENVKIEAGSGELNLSNIQTKDFELEVGAGNVIISNILVEKKADIDGGAGKVIIKDSNLSNLDLDVGVGEFQIINTKLSDDSDIDAGIGKLEITLKGNLEDYKIIPSRGLGSFTIEDDEIEDNKTYGSGDNKIKINAGIGKIDINFIDENDMI